LLHDLLPKSQEREDKAKELFLLRVLLDAGLFSPSRSLSCAGDGFHAWRHERTLSARFRRLRPLLQPDSDSPAARVRGLPPAAQGPAAVGAQLRQALAPGAARAWGIEEPRNPVSARGRSVR